MSEGVSEPASYQLQSKTNLIADEKTNEALRYDILNRRQQATADTKEATCTLTICQYCAAAPQYSRDCIFDVANDIHCCFCIHKVSLQGVR